VALARSQHHKRRKPDTTPSYPSLQTLTLAIKDVRLLQDGTELTLHERAARRC
jgi:hypothetical protein